MSDPSIAQAQTHGAATVRDIAVGALTFRVSETGAQDGRPILLLHGFPRPPGRGATSSLPWLRPGTVF